MTGSNVRYKAGSRTPPGQCPGDQTRMLAHHAVLLAAVTAAAGRPHHGPPHSHHSYSRSEKPKQRFNIVMTMDNMDKFRDVQMTRRDDSFPSSAGLIVQGADDPDVGNM